MAPEAAGADTLAIMVQAVRDTLAQAEHQRRCVFASRVLGAALSLENVAWRAIPTSVKVYNADALASQDGTVRGRPVVLELGRLSEGSAISPAEWKPGGYEGHLVVLAEETVLLDPTAEQFNRPREGLFIVGPLVKTLPAGALPFDREGASVTLRLAEVGNAITYISCPETLPSVENHPDWRNQRSAEFYARKAHKTFQHRHSGSQ